MQIKYLRHSQIDKDKWDNQIDLSTFPIIYAKSWYLDVVSPNWEALILDDYKWIMPLTYKTKMGITYLFQPHFTQQLGIFGAETTTPEIVNQFLTTISKKFKLTEINLNQLNIPSNETFVHTWNTNLELSLTTSYENIYTNYNQNTKRNLKKAANTTNLDICETNEIDEIIHQFKINRGQKLDLNDNYYNTLKKIVQEASQRGKCKSIVVTNDEFCSGAIFAIDNERAIYLFSANSELGKKQGTAHFLIDQFIQRHLTQVDLLDFEGSNNTNLSQFYNGFGAKPARYPSIKINNLPRGLKWLKD